MKIIRVNSCEECQHSSFMKCEKRIYTGSSQCTVDGVRDDCPLEDAVECPICEGPSCVHTEQAWKAYFKIPAPPEDEK